MRKAKRNTITENVVQLVSREAAIAEFGEAAASVLSQDALVNWMKFVLTDDMPNKNGERVPEAEFDNLIKTGYYKPVKMMVGDISDGHEDAEPIGVITHLTREGNKIIALAALWPTERGDDVEMLKNRVRDNKPVNVSWEIFYGDREVAGNVVSLKDTVLRAVTIVGLPAYAGRTPVLAIASHKWNESYIESLPDTCFLFVDETGERRFPYKDLDGRISVSRFSDIENEISASDLSEEARASVEARFSKLKLAISSDADIAQLLGADDTLEVTLDNKELLAKIAELEATVVDLTAKLEEKARAEASVNEAKELAENEAKELKEKFASFEEELNSLREVKQELDKERERQEKLESLKQKFESANVVKPEEYFVENFDKLSVMDEASLDFMLQELVAFSNSEPEGSSSASSREGLPNVPGESGNVGISEIVKALRERRNK